jgi:hypothetical protein
MVGKIGTSIILAAAFFGASMRLPAASCVFSNAPSEKACAPACCVNKTCCETSQKNTAPPVQPLAKSGSDQQNVATLPATVAVAVQHQGAIESPVFSSAEWNAHSPPPLALICIRLI